MSLFIHKLTKKIQHALTCDTKIFTIIWLGQLISLIGSQVSSFALGIWVYQKTGLVTHYTLIYLFSFLPRVIISPIAGVCIDRYSRRWIMILSNSAAALTTGAIALLLITNRLEIWHIYVIVTLLGICNTYQILAYSAAITMLVPVQNLGRASGMTQLGQAIGQLMSPVLAGVLLVTIQLSGIILLDFVSFFFAIVTLLIVKFPELNNRTNEVKKESFWQEVLFSWNYIMVRPGLLGLLFLIIINNFTVSIVEVLLTPLVLSFTSTLILGQMLSFAGMGMLLGSLIMVVWGERLRRIQGVLVGELLLGFCMILMGLKTSITLIFVAGFFGFLSVPISVSSSQSIWQSKVAIPLQGRVFAVRRMLGWSSIPLAYLVAGPLADRVFEPLITPNGLFAGSIGQMIGVGTGRGIGLLFIVMGLLNILTTIVAYQYPPLRLIEDELPDATNDII